MTDVRASNFVFPGALDELTTFLFAMSIMKKHFGLFSLGFGSRRRWRFSLFQPPCQDRPRHNKSRSEMPRRNSFGRGMKTSRTALHEVSFIFLSIPLPSSRYVYFYGVLIWVGYGAGGCLFEDLQTQIRRTEEGGRKSADKFLKNCRKTFFSSDAHLAWGKLACNGGNP